MASAYNTCLLCGRLGAAEEVLDNETNSGKWHSACHHTACRQCLQEHIEKSLKDCETMSQLAIPCYVLGCPKRLPQRLVLEVSVRAQGFARAVDEGGAKCPRCTSFSYLHRPNSCAHRACELCWTDVARQECGQLAAKCWHPECTSPVEAQFWNKVCAVAPGARALAAAPAVLERLGELAWRPQEQVEPGPVCSVCREQRVALIHGGAGGASCRGHAACEGCWARWAEHQVHRCVEERRPAVRCLWPGCVAEIGEPLWQHLAGRSGVQLSEALTAMERRLAARCRLQANQLFPPSMQVECPRRECVGLGYLGYDTVMCFLCEHQWRPEDSAGEAVPQVDVEVVMGVAVKRCPKCSECIEKNGGCDHMTCRCRYEFYWSTLKPYRAGA